MRQIFRNIRVIGFAYDGAEAEDRQRGVCLSFFAAEGVQRDKSGTNCFIGERDAAQGVLRFGVKRVELQHQDCAAAVKAAEDILAQPRAVRENFRRKALGVDKLDHVGHARVEHRLAAEQDDAAAAESLCLQNAIAKEGEGQGAFFDIAGNVAIRAAEIARGGDFHFHGEKPAACGGLLDFLIGKRAVP